MVLNQNENHVIQLEAIKRATADPFPGALGDALTSDGIQIGSKIVRKLVAADEVIFKIVNSPILRMMLEAQKDEKLREDVPYTDQEEWGMVYQFTTPAREVYAVATKGVQEFERKALEMGIELEMSESKLILTAIMEQVKRSFATTQKYVEQAKAGGEISFFRDVPLT